MVGVVNKATPTHRDRHYQYSSRYYNLFGLPIVAYVPAECTYRTLYTTIISRMGCVCVCVYVCVCDSIFSLAASMSSSGQRSKVKKPSKIAILKS